MLWAGELEPPLLELLAALLIEKPSMFVERPELPDDLAAVVHALERDLVPNDVRGLPGQAVRALV